ncbi:MAG: glycoside hydrolase family 3 N-terminal domain-containing protein [Candidatus Neomarinimicrobiota bacterium]
MSNSIEKLVGQLIIAGFREKSIKNDSPILSFIKNFNLTGVILYDIDLELGGKDLTPGTRNIESPTQLKELTKHLQSISRQELLISVDQEGGHTSRLKSIYGFAQDTTWAHVGKLNSPQLTKQFSEETANTLKDAGINLNFAPVLDLDHGNGSVISDQQRACSDDPEKVIEHARIFIKAHRENGVITCGKHFPGLGSASGDTHEGITDITNSWTVKDLQPFDTLIRENELDTVMVSHAFDKKLDPNYPSSLSQNIITKMLRDDLDFEGVVICDDPSMRAISDHYSLEETFRLMLDAGVDLFCLGNNLIYDPDYIPNAINSVCNLISAGKIKKTRIEQSIDKIKLLKSNYGIGKK